MVKPLINWFFGLMLMTNAAVAQAGQEPLLPPTIQAVLPEEPILVGKPFVMKIVLSWQSGPGYQLVPEVTVPEGLKAGPVQATSKSFGQNAGQLVYSMEYTAKEPAEYVFGDLAVRYWQAGHSDKPDYERLSAITLSAVEPRYLGLTGGWFVLAMLAFLAIGGGLVGTIMVRKKKKQVQATKVDPAVELAGKIEQISRFLASGEVEKALKQLIAVAVAVGDEKRTAEYSELLERTTYGGARPSNSDLRYFLHLAEMAFKERYPNYQPAQQEEDDE